MTSEQLVLKYFNSWQEPADFEETANCLDENVNADLGFFKAANRAEFIGMMSHNPAPWKEVKLLFSRYTEDFGCIIYQGVNTQTNAKMRVAEALEIKDTKIHRVTSVISQLA